MLIEGGQVQDGDDRALAGVTVVGRNERMAPAELAAALRVRAAALLRAAAEIDPDPRRGLKVVLKINRPRMRTPAIDCV